MKNICSKISFMSIAGMIVSLISTHAADLNRLPPYDWNQYFIMPISTKEATSSVRGNQVLHTKSTNKPYQNDPAANDFVKTHLKGAKVFYSDAGVLRYAVEVDLKGPPGFWLEMGVGMARTINFIAGLVANDASMIQVHGFDSFQGLPEDWDQGDRIFKVKTFSLRVPTYMPPTLNNVLLYKGLFKDNLPVFRDTILQKEPIRFLHIDCDSYTPTSEVLTILEENIGPGTVIVFDELYNYPNYAVHEWKAFQEFLQRTGYKVEYLAYNVNHEQVAVLIQPGKSIH